MGSTVIADRARGGEFPGVFRASSHNGSLMYCSQCFSALSCEIKHVQDTMTTMLPHVSPCTVATRRYNEKASPMYWFFLGQDEVNVLAFAMNRALGRGRTRSVQPKSHANSNYEPYHV